MCDACFNKLELKSVALQRTETKIKLMEDRHAHWEEVYAKKQPHEVSWTQERPETSLRFISEAGLPTTASIIDIGGGESRLVDCLLELGFTDLTVLDISESAIARAKFRLGDRANGVTWVVADIEDFVPERSYDLWHDRATFHFLTTAQQVEAYVAKAAIAVSGYLTIGTFSENGPERCSGLPVKQYSEDELALVLASGFRKIRCTHEDHFTPFNTIQNFLFCNFGKAA
jgi:SAM-dependent methyltransferase